MEESLYFEREFELRFLKSRGLTFQDLFADLMESAFPSDFQRVRSHGNSGDLKCDGYLTSKQAVFQVYGPDEIRSRSRLLRKIRDDLSGAMENWNGRMDLWVFVHNCQSGLPPQAIHLLDDLAKTPGAPRIERWGYQELRRLLIRIDVQSLQNLFPGSLSLRGSRLNEPPDSAEIATYLRWCQEHFAKPSKTTTLSSLQVPDLPIRLTWDTSSVACPKRHADLIHALRKHRKVLILADSGAGKSTLLRRFARDQVESKLTKGFSHGSGRVPILIDLWRFTHDRPVATLLAESVVRSGARISSEQIFEAIRRGYITLLLDGLDEIRPNDRRECLAQILSLLDNAPRAWLVMTSRPFPEPPQGFSQLTIAPLTDQNIADALRSRFGSGRTFRDRFTGNLPEGFVTHDLLPEVRQLCQSPLTLTILIHLLSKDSKLPTNLYDTYNRFLSGFLAWEGKKESIYSGALATTILEELAYVMASSNMSHIPITDWVHLIESSGRTSQAWPSASQRLVESIGHSLLSTGLLRETDGSVSFSHRTFLEFLAARRVVFTAAPYKDSLLLQPGIARFLCGAIPDVTELLEKHFGVCVDVLELVPLLKEAYMANKAGGRFEQLYDVITFSEDLAVNLDYWPRNDVDFTEDIRWLVRTCIGFGPKAIPILKDAAHAFINAVQWTNSSRWFEMIVEGLEASKWPGAFLHRRLLHSGFFQSQEDVYDNCTEEEVTEACDSVFCFLNAVCEDQLELASKELDGVITFYCNNSEQ